jgi:hypothetical protein
MKPAPTRAISTPGAIVIALKSATAEAEASSEEIATIGRAVRVMRLPTALTACAAHNRRKFACVQSESVTVLAWAMNRCGRFIVLSCRLAAAPARWRRPRWWAE